MSKSERIGSTLVVVGLMLGAVGVYICLGRGPALMLGGAVFFASGWALLVESE